MNEQNENSIDETTIPEIIAIFLNSPEVFHEYRSQLTPDMFYEYAKLYTIMTEIADEDNGFTVEGLFHRYKGQPESIKRFREIMNRYVNDNRIDSLLRKVKQRRLDEELRKVARTMQDGGTDADERLRYVQQKTLELFSTSGGKLRDPKTRVKQWLEKTREIAANPSIAMGMLTGLRQLDTITKGFKRQDFVVVGARTSMGKSAFVLEVAMRLTQKGYKGAIFSLEMSENQIYNRMAANLSQYNLEWLSVGNINDFAMSEFEKNATVMERIYIDDTRGVTADYIVDVMRQLKRERGLDFVIVDYVQDVKEAGEHNDNSGSAVSRICRKLRMGAQQCDCAMIGLSQVKRSVEERPDKRPMNSDLSDSTGIETAADTIMLLYRDEYYNQDTDKKGILEVTVSKNRNGKTGKAELVYDRDKQRIFSQ